MSKSNCPECSDDQICFLKPQDVLPPTHEEAAQHAANKWIQKLEAESEAARKERLNGICKNIGGGVEPIVVIGKRMWEQQWPDLLKSIAESFSDRSKLKETCIKISEFQDAATMVEMSLLIILGRPMNNGKPERWNSNLERLLKEVMNSG